MILVKIIFIVSFLGILGIVLKKIPQLLAFSQELETEESVIVPKRKIIDVEHLEKRASASLEKMFKKLRIFALKLENSSAKLSKRFQERAKKLSEVEKDYWGKFKNNNQQKK
jgi:hypothetical protein